MQILVDNSNYHLRNFGDAAMLMAAVARLRRLWPDATINVLTLDPGRLERYCPDAVPVSGSARAVWLESRAEQVTGRIGAAWLRSGLRRALECAGRIRRRGGPAGSGSLPPLDLAAFREAFRRSDIVLATGGGYITDSFKNHGRAALLLLARAMDAGKTAAMLGQGVGPIEDALLLRSLREVAPRLPFVALRECTFGPDLLRSVGVDPRRIVCTGDDAIELAHGARPAAPGGDLGVNLRIASYARVGPATTPVIRDALLAAVDGLGAPLRAIPIALTADCSDLQSVISLLGSWPVEQRAAYDSPRDIIEEIGRCRVVVTGSYHAGVFALAQGIPVVGLAGSGYYAHKFRGLQAQFGFGCEVIDLERPDAGVWLTRAILRSWSQAEGLRDALLRRASEQVDASKDAYERLHALHEEKRLAALAR